MIGLPDLLPMVRSEGVHCSQVIDYICRKTGQYKGRADEGISPELMTRFQLGTALEDSIATRFEQTYPGEFIRVGELEEDGIYLTPDLVMVDPWTDVEIKLTWMSARESLYPESRKLWKYWTQVKCYCRALRTQRGRLIIVHINGDGGRFEVITRVWDAEFTKQELRMNWDMILRNVEPMQKEKR